MAEGKSAYGTTLSWNKQPVAELTSISGPSLKVDTIDLTNHDSPDAFREYVAGLADGGEVRIEGNFVEGDTPGQIAMIEDAMERIDREVIITGPNDTFTWTFKGLITAFDFTYPVDGKLGFTATIKVMDIPDLVISPS